MATFVAARLAAAKRAATAVSEARIVKGYKSVCVEHPWSSSFLVCLLKGSLSDLFAQSVVENKPASGIDLRRTIVFASFGGLYCGMFQHLIYNRVYPVLFGAGTTFVPVASKIAAELSCSIERHHERSHIPIAGESLTPAPRSVPSLSMLAVSKATDSCTPPPPTQLAIAAPNGTTAEAFVEEVWERWKREVIPVTKAFCMVWGPAHVVTFGVCPPPFRITWVASCSFFWLVIKSVITHAEYNEAAAAGVVVAAAVDDVEGDD
eukprot:gene3059-27777_t